MWTVRGRLATVVFLVLFTQLLVYPGIDDLVAALGSDPTIDAGTAFLGIQLIAFVLFAVFWGALSDRYNRRIPFIVLGATGGMIAYLLLSGLVYTGHGDFQLALLLRFIEGAFTIGAFSLAITMLMDLGGGHGRNMGAAGIAIGAGAALGSPVGGVLYGIDPIAPVLASAFLLFVVIGLILSVPEHAPLNRHGIQDVLDRLRRTPSLLLPYTFGFADRFTAGFFGLVGTFYFRTQFNLDPVATGFVLACFFAPFALLQYPLGILSDRIGRVVPIVAGSVGYGIAIILVGLAPTIEFAAFGMAIVGILGAFVAPATMALVTDIADPGDRGAAMGGFNIFGSLGFLGGIILGGLIASRFGYLSAFLVAGGLEIVIVLVALPMLIRIVPDPTATFGSPE